MNTAIFLKNLWDFRIMKIAKFQQILKKKGIDAALFYTLDSDQYNQNMDYFSSYKGMGCLVIPKNKNAFLLTPEMEYERAKQSSSLPVIKWEKGKRLFQSVADELKKRKIKIQKVGIVKD
jgi:Xaa-Pro aminopeptidase